MREIRDPEYVLVGLKLVLIARSISNIEVIRGSGAHRTQRVSGRGTKPSPARCYIDIPVRIK
ncbi:hypothetical protein B6U96_13090 [Archaeoglobales archaeon ex4484_92]|nr:MAG: hypothetical protein B6U96_13090 [Archaeoglobales archaeon ex4484_92]